MVLEIVSVISEICVLLNYASSHIGRNALMSQKCNTRRSLLQCTSFILTSICYQASDEASFTVYAEREENCFVVAVIVLLVTSMQYVTPGIYMEFTWLIKYLDQNNLACILNVLRLPFLQFKRHSRISDELLALFSFLWAKNVK